MTHTQRSRTHLLSLAATLLPALLLVLGAERAESQVFASEHALTAQTVNGTTITVEYYRPEARGREVFGKLVRYGRPWTPGANWATTIDVDHDVQIEGQPLPKGKYSVWALPQESEWTIILHRKARAFHTIKPPDDDEQLRLVVKPAQAPFVEVLTWWFPRVAQGPELHMQWGTVDIPLHIVVGPAAAVTALGPEERARYVGVYRMTHGPRSKVASSTWTVFDSASVLRLRREVAPDMYYDAQFDMLRVGEHAFQPIMYRAGKLVGVEPAMMITFAMDGARATSVEVRGPAGTVTATGVLEKR